MAWAEPPSEPLSPCPLPAACSLRLPMPPSWTQRSCPVPTRSRSERRLGLSFRAPHIFSSSPVLLPLRHSSLALRSHVFSDLRFGLRVIPLAFLSPRRGPSKSSEILLLGRCPGIRRRVSRRSKLIYLASIRGKLRETAGIRDATDTESEISDRERN